MIDYQIGDPVVVSMWSKTQKQRRYNLCSDNKFMTETINTIVIGEIKSDKLVNVLWFNNLSWWVSTLPDRDLRSEPELGKVLGKTTIDKVSMCIRRRAKIILGG